MGSATVRHADTIARLRRAIMTTPGAATLDERAAAESAGPTGTAADAYLDKVRRASYRIVDADIDSLKATGLTEDSILELTLAAALGEATRIFERAITALQEAPVPPAAAPSSGASEA